MTKDRAVKDRTMKASAMKDRAHDDAMAELFGEDPDFAARYLNDILAEGDPRDLLIALRQMAQAFGGVPATSNFLPLGAATDFAPPP